MAAGGLIIFKNSEDMANVTHDIVQKLWNLCNTLKDDGVTYHQYVTELTYLLFLKMAKETGTEDQLPKGYRWDDLEAKAAPDRLEFYKLALIHLGGHGSMLVKEIFANASSFIKKPATLSTWCRSSTSSTGTARGRKASATCMKGCSRRTPTRRSPAPVSTSRRGR